MIPADLLAEQLTLIAIFFPEYRAAIRQDQERRFLRRVYGVVITDHRGITRIRSKAIRADIYSAYLDSLHPPGVTVFRSRTSGRKRRRPAPKFRPYAKDWLLDRLARGLPLSGTRL